MEINKVNDLSFYSDQGILTIPAKQYDTGRKFSFNIIADDAPLDLSDCIVYLRILKADGTQFQGEDCCSISGSIITVDTSVSNGEQILTCAGINQCEIHLRDNNGKSLTTWPFNIEVIPRVHDGSHMASIDSWDSWDKMKDNVYDLKINLSKKADIDSPALTGTPKAPTASAGTNTEQIATTAFVQKAVSDGIAASDALIFKGTIGSERDSDGNIINGTEGTVTELPFTYKTGWTYRVIAEGTYAGQVCEIGDLIVALNDSDEPMLDSAGNNITVDSDWCVAQTNINGAITGIRSGDAYIEYSQSGSIVTLTHKDVKRTDSTSTVSPSNGKSFTAVKSITSDTKGHITGVNTETVTLPNITTDSIGAYSKSGGDILGPLTVYSDGTKPNPDLKVRDGRIDIFKDEDEGDSSVVIDKSKSKLNFKDFKEIVFTTLGDFKVNSSKKTILGFYDSIVQIGGSIIDAINLISNKISIGASIINLASSVEFVGQNDIILSSKDNTNECRGVLILHNDSATIGVYSENNYQEMLKDLNEKVKRDINPEIGVRIEYDGAKFTFYDKLSGVKNFPLNVRDLMRKNDEIQFNGLSVTNNVTGRTNYGVCSTSASTINKVVSINNFSLVTGAEISVYFNYTNTAANPTLNVNNTGAKAILYNGTNVKSGQLLSNNVYTFRYNGSYWILEGGLSHYLENVISTKEVELKNDIEELRTELREEIFDLREQIMPYFTSKWVKSSNGTYKFEYDSSTKRFRSNNYKLNSTTALSTWNGILARDEIFTLKYQVSSESNFDKLTITLDGNIIVNAISGDGSELTYTTTLSAGEHTLTAKYVKDSSNHTNDDRAYLQFDNVVIDVADIVNE